MSAIGRPHPVGNCGLCGRPKSAIRYNKAATGVSMIVVGICRTCDAPTRPLDRAA